MCTIKVLFGLAAIHAVVASQPLVAAAVEPPAASLALPAGIAAALNAQPAVNRPPDAEAPSAFSVDHAAHAMAYGFQAPSIALVPLRGGRTRVWVAWYQQNNNPGGGAIGQGSTPHCVYAYSDNPFNTTNPTWHRAFYLDPVAVAGNETASDPEVAALPDGRLLCSYITSNANRSRRRSTYAFLVANPAGTPGTFQVGRQHWLEYGVLSQPFHVGSEVYAVIDEWGVARRFCRLAFSSVDGVSALRKSDIPWPGHPKLTTFFESSLHVVSGGRYRAYRRTKDGVYTSLSEVGGLAWGPEEKWTDHGSSDSRNVFARSPYSGRVIGAVNSPPDRGLRRTDLTLCVSEEEGKPGSFVHALNIEPDFNRTTASQYPRLAFDASGYVYCVYRWSDRGADAPHNGAAIIVARLREGLLAAGRAGLADVEKRVAVILDRGKGRK